MVTKKLMKNTWYPRVHYNDLHWASSIDSSNTSTIIPIAMYDEGKGTPSGESTHPSNSSFAVTDEPNCYPESRVNDILVELEVSLTNAALETDKVTGVKYQVMPIFTSFQDELDKTDEKSALATKSVLELQYETTDNQTYPLWSGTKVTEKYSGSFTYPAAVPGLTTNQIGETIAWNETQYYDMLHYYTNGGVLRKMQGGLSYHTLTRQRPVKKHRFRINSKTKRMNLGTFFGIMVGTHKAGTDKQIPIATEVSAVNHLHFSLRFRFNEWNEGFDMDKV